MDAGSEDGVIELYPIVKLVHVGAVAASGTLFFGRGIGVQLGGKWAMTRPLRYFSYALDTVLLAAALMLCVMLHQYPFVQSWLTAKVLLLVVYIVLGTFALKRGRTASIKAACFVGAVIVFIGIVSIARTHDALGALHGYL